MKTLTYIFTVHHFGAMCYWESQYNNSSSSSNSLSFAIRTQCLHIDTGRQADTHTDKPHTTHTRTPQMNWWTHKLIDWLTFALSFNLFKLRTLLRDTGWPCPETEPPKTTMVLLLLLCAFTMIRVFFVNSSLPIHSTKSRYGLGNYGLLSFCNESMSKCTNAR